MSPWIVSDELWDRLEPLLPQRERRFCYPGLKPLSDREVLRGILYVLHTGIQREYLPKDLGFGSGMTCWRRLRDWNEACVWQRLHEILLAELNAASRLDWSRCVVDSSRVGARLLSVWSGDSCLVPGQVPRQFRVASPVSLRAMRSIIARWIMASERAGRAS